MNAELKVEIVHLDPGFARELLSHNTDNYRKPSEAEVGRLADALRREEFDPEIPSNDAIVISESGVLLNGQHRCFAVIRTGVSIPVILLWGARSENADTMDTGRKRTAATVLMRHGIVDANNVAATIRRYHEVVEGRRVHLTNPLILGFAECYGGALRASVLAGRKCEATVPRALAGGLHFAFALADQGAADYFMERLADGEGLYRGNPIHTLRNMLLNRKRPGSNKSIDTFWCSAVTIKAWNAWKRGDELRVLKWRPGDSDEAYPQIEGLSDFPVAYGEMGR